ncbi:uncharacterized protein CANTADRAFT_19413 [Suhomyces tanzawaensis NRRL Y-17324]|uniref:Uncharacterized protein n=1 Tax=Suhomyces tanzawaensis NRRL Y-17324 TaxID=984487 RepID=A0A1E4SQW8_9ASCO|nr:uncharacterized protein CANTADRAFT_19413 [Suhomyces tanzawaensis NRRL Y-17324]ODV81802.1 hypothetical protein CANTADRAFT_19413 [Suhomyces tanzawaensis NRRL Y-17324]
MRLLLWLSTVAAHHVHHNHNHNHARAMPTLAGNPEQSAQKSMTTFPSGKSSQAAQTAAPESSSTTSYSYSIAIPAATAASHGSPINPNIQVSHLPENLVFIVFGAIIAMALLVAIAYRAVTHVLYSRQAKSEKEVYYANFLTGSGSDMGSNFNSFSSNSSMLEKTNPSSNSSIYLLQRQSSLLRLQQLLEEGSYSDSSNPGRAYRDNFNHSGHRGSMYFSPVMDIMNTKRASQLELPLHHSSTLVLLPIDKPEDSPLPSEYSCGDGFMYDSSFDLDSLLRSQKDKEEKLRRPPLTRPPSQLLDDLINEA